MVKIIINRCYGGFGLSQEAFKRLIELGVPVQEVKEDGWKDASDDYIIWDVSKVDDVSEYRKREPLVLAHSHERSIRSDPRLIQTVEELGARANGSCADLKIVEIPDDVEWEIEEYDGSEWIAEKHRTWSD